MLPDCASDKRAYLAYVEALARSWADVGGRLKNRRRDLPRAQREYAAVHRRAEAIVEDDCTRRTRTALVAYFDAETESMNVFVRRQANVYRILRDWDLSVLAYWGTRVNFLPPWRVRDAEVLRSFARAVEFKNRLTDTLHAERATDAARGKGTNAV